MAQTGFDIYSWRAAAAKITSVIESGVNELIQNTLRQDEPDGLTREKVRAVPLLASSPFVDPDGSLKGVVQVFIIEFPGHRILVDTGAGPPKKLHPFVASHWNEPRIDLLQSLTDAGFPPDSFTEVLLTHCHFDHIGNNTRLVGEEWVSSFEKADYWVSETELAYIQENPRLHRYIGYEESIAPLLKADVPLLKAGRLKTFGPDFCITDEASSVTISIVPTPGHTPGHVSILIASKNEYGLPVQALITADALHSPVQAHYTEYGPKYDDGPQAQASRIELMERFSDDRTLILGAHFPRPTAGYFDRVSEGRFRFIPCIPG